MSEHERAAAEEEWGVESKKREQTRKQFGITEILRPEEVEEYNRAVADAIEIYKVPPAPAMPVQQSFFDDPESLVPSNGSHAMVVRERSHEDSEAQAGYASDTYFALAHTPIDISKAMKIPKARKALDAEWSK